MKRLKIYAINDSPVDADKFNGATVPVVKWTDVCHMKPFVAIHYITIRHTSRWSSEPNKRPFKVRYHSRNSYGDNWSHSSTLAGAEKIARRLEKDLR